MSNIIHRSPTVGLAAFDDFDHLIDDLWRSFATPSVPKNMPTADIYSEDDKHMVIELAAPGFSQNDIEINIRNGMLEISGHRSEKDEQDSKRSYIIRGSSASFVQRVMLPEGVDTENISAELEKGVLKVSIPIERPQAKRISVTSGRNSGGTKKLTANKKSK